MDGAALQKIPLTEVNLLAFTLKFTRTGDDDQIELCIGYRL